MEGFVPGLSAEPTDWGLVAQQPSAGPSRFGVSYFQYSIMGNMEIIFQYSIMGKNNGQYGKSFQYINIHVSYFHGQ